MGSNVITFSPKIKADEREVGIATCKGGDVYVYVLYRVTRDIRVSDNVHESRLKWQIMELCNLYKS